jgi:hypothetical protein
MNQADKEALAKTAARIMSTLSWDLRETDGIEIEPGFFNVWNTVTGQSRKVLFHPESGFIFKPTYVESQPREWSGRSLGEVNFDGVTYPVRLPEYSVVMVGGRAISVEEYIYGEPCGCGEGGWCDHSETLQSAVKMTDTHNGNWKIQGDEIVIFDFESLYE